MDLSSTSADSVPQEVEEEFLAELEVEARQYEASLVKRLGQEELRSAGDLPGHEFHGNQWKEGSHAEHLGQLTKGESVTPAHVEKITSVLNALPSGFLKEAGAPNVHLTTKTIQSTGQSRGGHAAAHYNADENSIKVNVVGAPGRTATKPESALVHELGHAFQTRTGVSVEDAFRKDIASMKPADAHFLTHYTASSREAFAQAVAHTYGKVSNRAEFSRAFKNTIAATQKHLRSRGAMPTGAAAFNEPRSASRHPESAIHAAADAHLNAMTVAVSYGFMKAKKQIKGRLSEILGRSAKFTEHEAKAIAPLTDDAVKAIRAALLVSLPPALEKCYMAGGKAGAEILLKQLSKVK